VVLAAPYEDLRRFLAQRGHPYRIVGLKQPTWREVEGRHYEPWDRPHITIDTAGRQVAECLEEIGRLIDAPEISL